MTVLDALRRNRAVFAAAHGGVRGEETAEAEAAGFAAPGSPAFLPSGITRREERSDRVAPLSAKADKAGPEAYGVSEAGFGASEPRDGLPRSAVRALDRPPEGYAEDRAASSVAFSTEIRFPAGETGAARPPQSADPLDALIDRLETAARRQPQAIAEEEWP